jgi:ABC-type uncharacterized transport system fused permease/ATPase subunit
LQLRSRTHLSSRTYSLVRSRTHSLLLLLLLLRRPSTFVNSCIRFLERQLSLAFRTNLTNHFRRKYMSARAFFHIKDDDRIDVVDQRLTDGVAMLCDQTAHIYSEFFPH